MGLVISNKSFALYSTGAAAVSIASAAFPMAGLNALLGGITCLSVVPVSGGTITTPFVRATIQLSNDGMIWVTSGSPISLFGAAAPLAGSTSTFDSGGTNLAGSALARVLFDMTTTGTVGASFAFDINTYGR